MLRMATVTMGAKVQPRPTPATIAGSVNVYQSALREATRSMLECTAFDKKHLRCGVYDTRPEHCRIYDCRGDDEHAEDWRGRPHCDIERHRRMEATRRGSAQA